MTVTEAVRELRRLSGLSQQFFATKLNMSTRALHQYEHGKTPEPKQLLAYAAYAITIRRPDIHHIFARALAEELQAPPGFDVAISIRANESVVFEPAAESAGKRRRVKK